MAMNVNKLNKIIFLLLTMLDTGDLTVETSEETTY